MVRVKEFLSCPLKSSILTDDNNGCFLCNASADRADRADRADLDQEVRMLVQRGFNKLSQALQTAISELAPKVESTQVSKQAEALLAIFFNLTALKMRQLQL